MQSVGREVACFSRNGDVQFRAIVHPGHGLKTAGWLNYYLLERGRRMESKVRQLGAPQGEEHRSAPAGMHPSRMQLRMQCAMKTVVGTMHGAWEDNGQGETAKL